MSERIDMSDESESTEPTLYFVRARGKTMGPFSLERLQTMRTRGQLSRVHEVSTDKQDWQSAANLDALAAAKAPDEDGSADNQDSSFQNESAPLRNSIGPPPPAGGKASWYYHAGGETHGPVSLIELRTLVSNRQVTSEDLVWKDGLADWLAIPDVPELRQSLSGSSPASPLSQPMHSYDSAPGPNNHSQSKDAPLPRTSGLAISGLSLGVLGISFSLLSGVALLMSSIAVLILASLALALGFLSVFSIIFSAVALKDINQSRGTLTGKGIAISGLVIGIAGTLAWAGWLFLLIESTRIPT